MNIIKSLFAFLVMLVATLLTASHAQAFALENHAGGFFLGTLDCNEENKPSTRNLCRENGWLNYDTLSGCSVATNKPATETVQRWMSRAELEATQSSGLLRGGREGTHFVTDAANTSAQRARQRLALPQTPEVRVTMEVPAGSFSPPSRVQPAFNMPGGGMERTATGNIPVNILRVD
jgi:hypothetical protein